MRGMIVGGCVTIAAAGVWLFTTDAGAPRVCEPCVTVVCPASPDEASAPACAAGACPAAPAVVEVFDLAAALAAPPAAPAVTFDEPPLARPVSPGTDIVPTGYAEPADEVEVAPMPRIHGRG